MLKRLLELIPKEQEKLNKEAQNQSDKEKLLLKIITNIRNSLDINDTLNSIYKEISGLFDVPIVILTEFPDKNNYLNSVVRVNYGAPKADHSLLEEEGIKQWGILQIDKGCNISIDDVNHPSVHKSMRNNFQFVGISSILGVPIKKGDEIWGSISIGDNKVKHWTANDAKLLKLLAEHIYIAINQAEQYAEIKKHAEREALLRKITEIVKDSLDINEIINSICKEIAEIFKVQRVVITDFKKNEDGKLNATFYNANQDIKGYNELSTAEQEKNYEYIYKVLLENDSDFIINNILECDAPTYYKKIANKLGVKSALGIPIKIEDKTWGAIFIVEYNEYRYWTDEEITLLHAIANKISIAIRQAELYSQTKMQAQREKLIREIVMTASSSLNPAEIQSKLVKMVAEIFKPDKCFIRPFDNQLDAFTPVQEHAGYFSSSDLKKEYCFSDEIEALVKSEYKKGKAFTVSDFNEFLSKPEPFCSIGKRQIEHYKILANYCFPIIIENELIGAFVLQFKEKTYLDSEEIDLLKIIIGHAAISLKQAELYSQAQKQAQREALLKEIIEAVKSSLNIDEVLNITCQKMLKLFKVDRVAIGKYASCDNFSTLIQVNEATSDPNIQLHKNATIPVEINEYLSECLLKKGRNLIIDDMEDEKIPKFYREFHRQMGTKSILNVAIKKGAENWGIMAIFQNDRCRHWTREEIDLMQAISKQMFIAIRQAELFEKIKKQSEQEFILRKITETIRNYLNINQIKQSIVDETGKIFDADRCVIRLWNNCTHSYMMVEQSAEYLKSKAIKSIVDLEPSKELQEYLIKMFENKGILYAPDLDNLDKEQEAVKFLKTFDVKSAYACPIHKDNSPVGFVIIQFTKSKVILEDGDMELLKTIASQSGVALKQADLYTRTKIQAERSDFLRKIIETVGDSLDLEFLLNAICKEIFELFKADRVAIENYPNKGDYSEWSVTSQHISGPDILGVNDIEYSQKSKEYLGIRMLEEGRDIVADDIEKSDLPDYFIDTHKKMNIKSYIAVPLKKGDNKWGALALSQVHNYRKWTKGEIQLLHMVADQVCIAIR